MHENLRLAARAHALALALSRNAESNRAAMTTADALIERLGLGAVATRAAGELSHGQQRRLEVGMAMAAKPAATIPADKPTWAWASTTSTR